MNRNVSSQTLFFCPSLKGYFGLMNEIQSSHPSIQLSTVNTIFRENDALRETNILSTRLNLPLKSRVYHELTANIYNWSYAYVWQVMNTAIDLLMYLISVTLS